MPNCYISLGRFKRMLGNIPSTATGGDAAMLDSVEEASRWADEFCHRHFYSIAGTRYYRGSPLGDRRRLWLPDDLISVTSLKVDEDGDETYEMTLAVNTDYWLWPYNRLSNEPAYAIDLDPEGTQLYSWPTSRPRPIQLVGLFGYSDETEVSGTTAEELDAAETGVDMTTGHGLTGGETIRIGTEDMDVSSVATNTLTVVRGVNGTTAATHATSSAVTRRRFPRLIELAVGMEASRSYRELQTGYSGQMAGGDFGGQFASLYPKIHDRLMRLRQPRVA